MMASNSALRVVLAQPRGFCAGVDRAIEIVELALARYGAPVYVRHEIVHNHHVVERLRGLGAIFVKEVSEVPRGAVTVFSAHGVSRHVEGQARLRALDVIDATCPLVHRVHQEGRRYAEAGYDVILIGHRGHAEVEGTQGQVPGRVQVIASPTDVAELVVADPAKVAYITQTTLSPLDTREVISALKARFPAVKGPDTRDICYATHNRQQALLGLVDRVDMVLVVGARNSSNTARLREIGERAGLPTHLIGHADEFETRWLDGVARIALTAGASAPESLVQGVLARLSTLREVEIEIQDGKQEHVRFRLPPRFVESPEAQLQKV